MKQRTVTVILVLAMALTTSAAPGGPYGAAITPENPDPICVGDSITLTATWLIGQNGLNWYQWFVKGVGVGSPVGFDASAGAGNLTGSTTYTFTGASADSYEISFKVWHDSYPDQADRYADDSVTIVVENCGTCDWKAETAWAAGLPYVVQGNWATYTPYDGEETEVDLLAGQTLEAGTVHLFAPDGNGDVTILIVLNEDWRFAEDVTENVKVQDYDEAPSGNPSPGLFAHKGYADPANDFFIIVVPDNNFYGIHVDVERLVCEQ